MLGGELIDGNAADADVLAGSLANGKASQVISSFSIVTIALVTMFLVETGEDEEIVYK